MEEEEVIISIKSCINSSKGGILFSRINCDYRDLTGENIPYSKLGYPSLRDFIYSIEDIQVTRTGSDGDLLTCCGGKAEHIAKLVSLQKSSSKPPRKKYGKVISLPRGLREQSGRAPTRNGSSWIMDLKTVSLSEQKHQKHTKSGYENSGFKANLPPRLRAKAAAGYTTGRAVSPVSTNDGKDIGNSAVVTRTNGSKSFSNRERPSPKPPKTSTSAAGKGFKKSRLAHSQNFINWIVDEGGVVSGEAGSYNGSANSVKEETTVDKSARLLRGPSAYVSVSSDKDTPEHHSLQLCDSLATETLRITVSDSKRNVSCTNSLSWKNSHPKSKPYSGVMEDNYDHVFERDREKERLGTSGYGGQEPNLDNTFDISSRLVGRVASQRRIRMFSGMEKLPATRNVDRLAAGHYEAIESLTRNLSDVNIAGPTLQPVSEPLLFHYLLVGDDFLLNLAHSSLGFKCLKFGNRPISCGLCCSGQNMRTCLSRIKQCKLLSKIMLLLGAVDILEGLPFELMKSHMTTLVCYLRERVKLLVVLTVPPLPLIEDTSSWQKLMQFNRWLVNIIGRQHGNVVVIDIWHLFDHAHGFICNEMFEENSLPMYKHDEEVLLWNDEGQRKLVDFLRGVVPYLTPLGR